MKLTRPVLLILILCILAIGLVIVIGIRVDQATRQDIVTSFSQRQLLLAEQAASGIQAILDEARRGLLQIQADCASNHLASALAEGDEAEIAAARAMAEQDLLSYLHTHPIYTQIRYIDPSGQEVVGVDRDGGTARIIPPDQLRSQAEREFFAAAMQLEAGQVYVSAPEGALGHGGVGAGAQAMHLATPVLDSQGGKAGVIALNLAGEEMRTCLTRLSATGEMDAWVMDEKGVEIVNVAHPEREGSNAYEYCRQTGDQTLISLAKEMLAGNEGVGIYLWPEEDSPATVRKLLAYAPIYPSAGRVWSLGVSVPYDSILAAHGQINKTLLLLGGGIVAIILLMLAFAIRSARKQSAAEEKALQGEELKALQETSLALTAQLEPGKLLRDVVERGCHLLDVPGGVVYLVDESRGDLELIVSHGYTRDHTGARLSPGAGVGGRVLQSGAPLVVNDYSSWEGRSPDWEAEPLTAVLGAPLKRGERVIGVLEFSASNESRNFDAHDLWLTAVFANQAAVAIENAHLYERMQQEIAERRQVEETLRRRAAQLALINDVGRKIAAVLDLDSVLERTAHLVQESFGYHHVGLFTLDRERGQVVMRAKAGEFAHMFPPGHRLKLDQGMVGWVAGHGQMLLANDVDTAPHYTNLYPDILPTGAELSVPIAVSGEVVGVLDVQSPHPNAFDESDVMTLETLADQIAAAIENARLYEEIERELTERKRAEEALARHNRELELLNRASQAFSSTLDQDQVLAATLEETRRMLGVTACSIWLVEPESEELVCRHSIGPRSEVVRGWRLRPGEGFAGWVAQSGESLIVPDVQADERYFKGVDEQTGLSLRSILNVPLRTEQRVTGVLQVMDTHVGSFDAADLKLVEPLAASAAIAIENARLHRQVLDYAGQLEQRVQERTAQLEAQYARLEAILHGVSDGIIVASKRGDMILVNPIAQSWLDRTLLPEDAAQLREAIRDLAQRADERPELVLELGGLDLELKAAPVVEGETKPGVAVVAVHDVSHLKALDRVKTRFVSNVSHELRTPITTIKLYAALMHRQPDKWEQYLDTLTMEADHQAQLVEDILQISHIDTGRLEMKLRSISLNELAEAAVVNRRALAKSEGVTLECRPSGPEIAMQVDPDRMMQVLNNLVENAIHYTPDGGKVTVSTGTEETEGRTWATVQVADTGMGIPEEELPHIFERFFRGEEPRVMQISGTGLGLAIVKEIVELHGGRVTVESEVGVGSTFTVWLPFVSE